MHTGFEWNKYNQTHYDLDNPPPKVVQGYKFNIFYPDLIDKVTTTLLFKPEIVRSGFRLILKSFGTVRDSFSTLAAKILSLSILALLTGRFEFHKILWYNVN